MKKKLWMLLSAAMVLNLAVGGTSILTQAESADITYTAGTYSGSATGHNGTVSVEVTLSETAIESIEVTESSESSGIGDVAAEHVISDVINNQSLDVDTVSGCTISRAAFLSAIKDALNTAGADVSALEQVPVEETVTEDFTIEADVAVIGSGAAGMSAAIEAAEAGSTVVVLEKLARTGGSSRLSSAMLVAGGTELQEAAGIEDTVEALKEYWVERGEGNIDEEMTDYVAENVNDALDWLMDMGVDYENGLILYSGTADVARAHMPLEGGRNMMDAMVAKAESLGVEIYLETPALSLIQDEDGAVVGVMAEQNGASVTVNAKAVVVATGGYGWNSDLIAEYSPNAEGAWSVSSTGSTGDGLLMAMDVGADTVFKGGFIGWKVSSPSYGHTTSQAAPIYGTPNLIVNENGERFCDESEDYPFMYNDMLADGSDLFYFIFAGESDETTDLENNVSDTVANLELAVEAGICYKADTIEELAEVAGLDSLVEAVENFNSAIDAGTDEEFGRDTSGMTKYENGPFYAIQSMRATLGTFGGLNTNITGEVVDTDGNDIPGLYAAGEVANGEFFPEIYPASGSSLSMCVVLGREAGKSAAAYVQQQ